MHLKKTSTAATILSALGFVAIMAATLFILPFISFWLSYFGGWITMKVIGPTLCKALSTLFCGTAYFTPDMIPWISGALGWIGGFFRNSINFNKDNK